ncbi:SDR family oxidoreductase [Turicibacter bilis]|uniref:SDR family oxidoreductase n=1 Tax=Turicibacter bilis TaxID=2735723 RepID=UPI0031BAF56F
MTTPCSQFPKTAKPQTQTKQPGIESQMDPKPIYDHPEYNNGSGRLKNKVAIITGGDSGIGRAVALAFAKEGAKVVVVYYDETEDANETKQAIEQAHGECLLIQGDLTNPSFAQDIVNQTLAKFNQINILVNNAAVQYPQNEITQIKDEDLHKTFAVNYFGTFYLTRAVVPHLTEGDSIINTTSVTAYEGNETLLDYSSTKGALTAFTRSLASNLAKKGIRVNAVAPGPIWTPLIPASFDAQKVSQHGANVPMKRMGHPVELAGAYVLLASNEGSYMSGITIHVNGGTIINC